VRVGATAEGYTQPFPQNAGAALVHGAFQTEDQGVQPVGQTVQRFGFVDLVRVVDVGFQPGQQAGQVFLRLSDKAAGAALQLGLLRPQGGGGLGGDHAHYRFRLR